MRQRYFPHIYRTFSEKALPITHSTPYLPWCAYRIPHMSYFQIWLKRDLFLSMQKPFLRAICLLEKVRGVGEGLGEYRVKMFRVSHLLFQIKSPCVER